MKYIAYIRIAKGTKKGYKIEASNTPSQEPLKRQSGYKGVEFLPTVSFAIRI